jgi:hypothetical protein
MEDKNGSYQAGRLEDVLLSRHPEDPPFWFPQAEFA